MEKFIELKPCDSNSCCCLSERTTIVMISLISLAGSLVDTMSSESCRRPCCPSRDLIDSVRMLLVTLFQMANLLLLLASYVENSLLVQIYVWYTLGFVVMGLVVAIIEFLANMKLYGMRSFIIFAPEVVFLFVIFRCLPLVDTYRKHLDTAAVKTFL